MKETIADMLLERVSKTPSNNSIGITKNGENHFISFKQYKEVIECYALALSQLDINNSDKVCILGQTCREWNYYDLAIMSIGAITIPIYPSYTDEEVDYIVNHSDAKIIILEDNLQLEKIIEIQDKINSVTKIISFKELDSQLISKLNIEYISPKNMINIGKEAVANNPDQFNRFIENLNPESVATIVYTSGTTGEPKGAVIKHKALFQVLKNVKKFVHSSVGESDRFLTFLPLSHVLGRLESFFPILFGSESVYATDMKKLIEEIPIVKPTLLMAVPRVLEKVYEKAMHQISSNPMKKAVFSWATSIANDYYNSLDENKTPQTSIIAQYQLAKKLVFNKIYHLFGGRIRFFISGGAPLSIKIIKFLRNANLTVLEGYGLTETVAPCFLNPLDFQVPGTVGQPMGDLEVKFADDGEILIRSIALFTEYYKNEDATKEVLDNEGWFRTGDIGKFTDKGYLQITDRKKDIIITSGGKNVAPQKIENLLKVEKHIAQSVIIGDKRKYLTALISIEKESFKDELSKMDLTKDCSIKDIAMHPLTKQLVKNCIDNVNLELASYETIKKFEILPIEISIENYLTPSLKIKKKPILKDFASLIDKMYQEKN